jgi:multiple sugar transport system substrate-binding protein
MIAGGEQADIIALKDMPSYSNYAKNKQLAPLDDYIAKDKVDLKNYNGITDSIKLDSKLYALPYMSDFWLMYYNKDIFDKAKVSYPASDMTWRQYSDLTKKLTSGSGNTQVYGGYTHTWKSAVIDFAVANKKGTLVDGKYEFLKPAYDVFLPMQNQDKSVMPLGTAKASSASYQGQFETGKAATVLMGTWFISQLIADKTTGKHNVNWGVVPVPHFEDGKAGDTFGNVTPVAINTNSKEKDAAWKFVKYLGTEKGAKIIANRGKMPAYRDTAIMDTFSSIAGFPTDSKKALQTTNVALEFPPDKNGAAIDKILQEEHELIMIGKNTVDQGIANMNKRVQEVINSSK